MIKDFDWLDSYQKDLVEKILFSPMPRGRGRLAFRNLPKYLAYREVDGKKHVVFLTYYLYPSLAKKSMVLRSTGKYHTTILAFCLREDSEPMRFFDDAYEVEDYNDLINVLRETNAATISVSIHPWIPAVIAIEARRKTGFRVVVDLNDSYLFISKNPDSPECVMEREVLKHSDAFIYRMSDEGARKMRNTWGFSTPGYQIYPLPMRDFFRNCRTYNADKQTRFVFAGGVIPYDIARSRGHENHIFDPLIGSLANGKSTLTIFANQNARDMFWEEHEHYFGLERKYPSFSFRKGVPFFKLSDCLSDFHFGVYYENYSASSYNPEHFRHNIATKIFSYLDAGLPILVHSKATYMRDLVEENGFGLIYDVDRLDQIHKLIDCADHEKMRRKVESYREKNDMSTVLHKLEEAYD